MIYGISKGGFAGGLGVIAVPLMALVVSPAAGGCHPPTHPLRNGLGRFMDVPRPVGMA